MADFNERLPEEMDEQHRRLIDNLRLIYSMDGQKAGHLNRIHQRLLDNEVPERPQPARDEPVSQRRLGDVKASRSLGTEKRPWRRQLSMIAAVLVAALVVGSLLIVLNMSHRRSGVGTPANSTGGFNTLLAFHMIDASTGWALTGHAVLYTADGGMHWKSVTPPGAAFPQDSVADFRSASIASIATPQPDGTSTLILHTTDSGATWQQATIQMPFPRQISFVDAQHGWLLASQQSPGGVAESVGVFRTTDAGKTWANIATALFADTTPPGKLPYGGQKTGMSFLDNQTGWVTGTATLSSTALLYITHDGGSTWQQQTLLLPPGMSSANVTVLSPSFFSAVDGVLPVIFSDATTNSAIATTIYTTRDGGRSWQGTALLPGAHPLLSFADMQHWWATDGAILYSTADGGNSWLKHAPGASFKNVTQLDFVSATKGWATSSISSTTSTMLMTVDSGKNWTPISPVIP